MLNWKKIAFIMKNFWLDQHGLSQSKNKSNCTFAWFHPFWLKLIDSLQDLSITNITKLELRLTLTVFCGGFSVLFFVTTTLWQVLCMHHKCPKPPISCFFFNWKLSLCISFVAIPSWSTMLTNCSVLQGQSMRHVTGNTANWTNYDIWRCFTRFKTDERGDNWCPYPKW